MLIGKSNSTHADIFIREWEEGALNKKGKHLNIIIVMIDRAVLDEIVSVVAFDIRWMVIRLALNYAWHDVVGLLVFFMISLSLGYRLIVAIQIINEYCLWFEYIVQCCTI